jgi:hypothetical protein
LSCFFREDFAVFDANDPNVVEFRRSLEQLIQDAQRTVQLGFQVAKEQVEDLVRTPGVPSTVDDLRKNLQTVAHELETRVKELIQLTATYSQRTGAAEPPASAAGNGYTARVYQEPPAADESATAAGAGTAQQGADPEATHPTPNGEVPGQ